MDNQIDKLSSELGASQLQKKTSFSGGSDLINAVIQLLDKFDDKLSTPELLSLLGFFNLIGIVSYLPREGSGSNLAKTADSLVQKLAKKNQGDENKESQGMLNMLMGLLSSKDKQGLNPGNMVSLLNLLNNMQNSTETRDLIIEKATPSLPKESDHIQKHDAAAEIPPDNNDEIRINSKEQMQKSLQWRLPK